MSEKFTQEELKRMAGPKEDGTGGTIEICPFCKTKNFYCTGKRSLGMDEYNCEFFCSSCGFDGDEDSLLNGTTKRQQVKKYLLELTERVKELQSELYVILNIRIASYHRVRKNKT